GERLVGIVSRADIIRVLAVRHVPVTAPAKDDLELRESVLNAIREVDGKSSPYINALVQDGVVHLWGLAQSPAHRDALQVAVENIPSVKALQNHLQVSPGLTESLD
ncbi:MAG: BON domain-containing protein, partial [Rhodospirillaceae bacterium]